jgi:hypothetical protein
MAISRHSRLNGQLWFDTGVLAKGRHTVELRYLGTRNLLSVGRAIQLDKLERVSLGSIVVIPRRAARRAR